MLSKKFHQEAESEAELMDACFDDVAYARVLLETDGSKNVNMVDENSNSLLHNLSYYDNYKAVALLLGYGADSNICNKVSIRLRHEIHFG